MKKKTKNLMIASIAIALLSSMAAPYCNVCAKNVKAVSDECVLQANEIKLNVKNASVNGRSVETTEIFDLSSGIMASISDATEVAVHKNLGGDTVEVNGVYSSANYCIGSNEIIASDMIVAEKNIQFNSDIIRSEQNTVIYSKNGNVFMNAVDVNFNGIIYAPNGTVYINSHNATVNGKIIAKKIVVSADEVVVNSTSEAEELFECLEFLRNDEMLNVAAYYNIENNKITLATELDDIRLKVGYARYDNGEFVKVTETKENLIRFDVEHFNDTADFMVVITDKFGNEIKSPIHSFKKDENDIAEVVLDADEDGIPDGYEVLLGTDTRENDTDKDGFNDGYEIITLGTDPLKFDIDSDFDNDGMTNAEEMVIGSNPFIKDSDFDGISDKNDASPLETDDATAIAINEEIPVVIGEFDYVKHYINENGEKCETVYNWLTDSVKKVSIGDKQVIGVFDADNHCTAMVTETLDADVVNTYTFAGDLITSATHNGNKYEYTYNNNSDLTDVSINGNVLFHTDYDNNIVAADQIGDVETEYSYDVNNNLVGITVDGEETFVVNYDENGSVVSYEDLINNVAISFNYETVDNEEVLKSVVSSNGFGYEYNNSESTYETKYSDGDTVKNQTAILNGDLFGDNYSVNISLITGNSKYVTEKNGNEELQQNILVNDENILSANWNIDEYGTRNISYQDGKVLDYSYDMNANLALVQENAEVRSSYEYDDFNQLIRENNAAAGITYIYDYDNYGNIISVTQYDFTEDALGEAVGQFLFGYTESSWNDLLTEFNGQKITYDGSGNPINYRDGMTFEWWAQKKISAVTQGDNTINYSYDLNGMRSSKEVNGVVTSFNYENGKIINTKTDDEIIWFMYDDNDSVIGMEKDGEAYYFEKNSQKDVERIFNSTGELICSYSYDAFGNIISVSGDENIAKLNPFRYRSYFYDDETGFYYLNTRYYDPVVRRFVNADSVDYLGINGSAISYNLFTYCNNNPVMFEDQNGNVFKYNSNYKVSGTFEKSVSYSPSTWNNNRLKNANCYAYALNIYANGFNNKLQPGNISGTTYNNRPEPTWEDSIINALYADLKKMSEQLNYQSGKYLSAWNWWYAGPVYGSGYDIALVTGYDYRGYFIDYHWYRKDSNGRWSHKPGYDTVRDYDNSGNKIYDPSKANRGIYNVYVTSFRLYRNSIW